MTILALWAVNLKVYHYVPLNYIEEASPLFFALAAFMIQLSTRAKKKLKIKISLFYVLFIRLEVLCQS